MIPHHIRLSFAALCVAVYISPAYSQADQKALKIAEATINKMGGMDRWNAQRYLVWDIFGESHYWDKWNGDFRWQDDSLLVIMNVQTMAGDAWIDGKKVTDSAELEALLNSAYSNWVNNSYWVIMPYKLLDEGVIQRYVGVDTSEAGQISDVIELTFDSVGLTPENKYHVFIDRETGMVCQWAYYERFDNEAPNFVRPWDEWKVYNGLWMSTGRGATQRQVTNLSLPEKLPEGIFTDPNVDPSMD